METLLGLPELLLRLSVALGLGALLGFEREWRSKPAGLRTHMLVALGAACFCLGALALGQESTGGGVDIHPKPVVDPTRVVQGIVGGIGFLGAGAIIRNEGSVEGLTTAGSIWLTGAVGVAVGAGEYTLAAVAAVLAALVLAGVGWLEHRVEQ